MQRVATSPSYHPLMIQTHTISKEWTLTYLHIAQSPEVTSLLYSHNENYLVYYSLLTYYAHKKKLPTKIILNKVCFSVQFVRAITNNNINILELPPEHDSIMLTLWSCGLQHCAVVSQVG